MDDAADSGPQAIEASLGCSAQHGLRLREGGLDWIDVGAVGPQLKHVCAGSLDGRADALPSAAPEAIHDDDVAWLQLRDEHLIDVGLEGSTIDRLIERWWRDQAAVAQACDEGGRPELRCAGVPRAVPGRVCVPCSSRPRQAPHLKITLETPAPNCSAAARHEIPAVIAATTRTCRSTDNAFAMHAASARQTAWSRSNLRQRSPLIQPGQNVL